MLGNSLKWARASWIHLAGRVQSWQQASSGAKHEAAEWRLPDLKKGRCKTNSDLCVAAYFFHHIEVGCSSDLQPPCLSVHPNSYLFSVESVGCFYLFLALPPRQNFFSSLSIRRSSNPFIFYLRTCQCLSFSFRYLCSIQLFSLPQLLPQTPITNKPFISS